MILALIPFVVVVFVVVSCRVLVVPYILVLNYISFLYIAIVRTSSLSLSIQSLDDLIHF